MLRTSLSKTVAQAATTANMNTTALMVRPVASVMPSSIVQTVAVRGQQTMPVATGETPLPAKTYSPFGTKQKNAVEWSVARLDDLLNWGRKGMHLR